MAEGTKPDNVESAGEEMREKRLSVARSWWPKGKLAGLIFWQRLNEEETFEQASALTYKTLFSLIPVFVLALLILGAVSSESRLDSMVQKLAFEQLQLDKMPMLDAQGKPAVDESGRQMMLSDSIKPMLDKAKTSVTGKTTVAGLIALGILLYGAISLMIVIEGAFNQIYGGVRGRSWSKRILLYWCVLTLGPIGVAASLVLGRMAFTTAASYAQLGWLVGILNILAGFVVSWAMILLLYKIVPQTTVQWRSAAMGALVAAFLWEVGKSLFGFYVQQSIGNSFYGSMVLLPLFMMWIYLTWTFILVGLQLSYVHQYWGMLRRRYFFVRNGGVVMTDLKWVLSLGVLLYRRFREGKSVDAYEASEALMIPAEVGKQLLIGLEKAGLVHETKGGTYSLARPPEEITGLELMTAAQAMCDAPSEVVKESKQQVVKTSAIRELEGLEKAWGERTTLAQMGGAA